MDRFMIRTCSYNPTYISYVESGESAAVFVVRDIVKSVPTRGRWIDVLQTKGEKNHSGRWNFTEITVELFPRKTNPAYPAYATDEEKKYLTWKAAHADITFQRNAVYTGPKFTVKTQLVNQNKGKYHTVWKVWNNTFEQYVPEEYFNSSCVYKEVRELVRPRWVYKILAVKRLPGKTESKDTDAAR